MPKESSSNNKTSSSSSNKVSQTVVSQEEQESPSEQEVWEIVRNLSKKDGKFICRSDDCQEIAVATWASNLDAEDKWDLCEACQQSYFGGEDLPSSNDPNDPRYDPATKQDQDNPETEPDTTETHHTTCTLGVKSTTAAVTQASQEDPADDTKSPTESSPCAVDQVQDSTTASAMGQTNNQDTNTLTPSTPSTQESSDAADTTRTPVPATQSKEEGLDSPQRDDSNAEQEDDDEEEKWDLKKIITFDNLKKDATIKCSTDDCLLAACSVWISNLDPKTKWYSCLDCQEQDFCGWPPVNELPVKSIQTSHLQLIAQKCSNQSKPKLPECPLDNTACSPTAPQKGDSSSKANKNNTHFVTPPPPSLQKKKPNAKAIAMHNKWQALAEAAAGGKDVRIVVAKPLAKKLISDVLYDSFRPMNISEINRELKSIVPSPVLSTCLKEMALDQDDDHNPFAADSDDEEVENSSKAANRKSSATNTSSDPYAGSLQLKIGKSQATNLYYVDYNKRKSLDVEERNELLQNIATANATEEALKETLKSTLALADKLLSEPTNEVMAEQLESQTAVFQDLEEKVREATNLKVNEKHKQRTKRKIQNMAAQWRRRKRLCMDFMIALEENTDGSIRAKKCLSGDGPIALDSDEVVAQAAVEFAKKKRARPSQPMKSRKSLKTSDKKNPNSAASLADEDFVAVNLDSQHCIRRIYVDDEMN